MTDKKWMIYGAYGYTGRLLAEEAHRQGLAPVIAGRNRDKTEALARELGFPFCSFSVDNSEAAARQLQDFHLVINCAGPFVDTVEVVVEACLASGTHYLDITGEIDVLEYCMGRNQDAKDKGIALCSGAGFDVVPTDCIAAALKEAMPDATRLTLAYETNSKMSPGTSKTSTKFLFERGRVRENGRITRVSLTHGVREIRIDKNQRVAVTIPWGDVSTAYYSTGIPNIEVYLPSSIKVIRKLKMLDAFRFLWAHTFIQNYVLKKIGESAIGPTAEERGTSRMAVWGEVKNAKGEIKEARMSTANGYDVTACAAVGIAIKLLREEVPGGAYTPSLLMGINYVCTLPGSSPMEIS